MLYGNSKKLMIIYLVGVSDVGKTTIGKMLAEKLGYSFFDLDDEVESFYQKPIERIQDEFFTMDGYRRKACVVLDNLFSNENNSVIAGTPAGLKFSYLRVYKKHKKSKEIISVYIMDSPENLLSRMTFYDKDSKPKVVILDESDKKEYLKEIIADYNFFKSSYKRADLEINIENVKLKDIPNLIINKLNEFLVQADVSQ
jgi:shikimate kinase